MGARGFPLRTDAGELSLGVQTVTVLSECEAPLPPTNRPLGSTTLTDPEARFSKRYLDLLSNPEASMPIFFKRARILRFLREFLDARLAAGQGMDPADHALDVSVGGDIDDTSAAVARMLLVIFSRIPTRRRLL